MPKLSKKMNKKIDTYQQELLKTHYAEVENMYRQIRGWRHDYRNHIQVLKTRVQSGDMDSVMAYLNELETDLNTVDTVIHSGNAMCDAILNSKISLAEAANIPVKADADIPVKLTVSDIGLCSIIGNLFDNAIEASKKLSEDKRMIRVYMAVRDSQFYISFTNFTADKKRTIFDTTKGEGHGLGLARIDSLVKKYGGYISRNSEDGAFSTEILLPQ
ncbi:MAG: GHKL domain-containing protein [Oscillospiraceae bacterium]|nr:GHKL domain-containing protein [Oscillospiraceae bacterium]